MKLPILTQALRFLNYRLRSKKELETKLKEKKYPPEEVDQVIKQLEEVGLLNDQYFARTLARSRLEVSRRGRRAIFWELTKLGVDKELINEVLGGVADDDELPIASQLLESRLKNWQNLPFITKKQRAISLLQRRGFSGAVIRQVLKNAALSGGGQSGVTLD